MKEILEVFLVCSAFFAFCTILGGNFYFFEHFHMAGTGLALYMGRELQKVFGKEHEYERIF